MGAISPDTYQRFNTNRCLYFDLLQEMCKFSPISDCAGAFAPNAPLTLMPASDIETFMGDVSRMSQFRTIRTGQLQVLIIYI